MYLRVMNVIDEMLSIIFQKQKLMAIINEIHSTAPITLCQKEIEEDPPPSYLQAVFTATSIPRHI